MGRGDWIGRPLTFLLRSHGCLGFEQKEQFVKGVLQVGQPCMTQEELQERDIFGAFLGFRTVREAKERGILPRGFWDSVPEQCVCGAEVLISPSLIHVVCCNPRCYVKLGYNLEKVYRNFGVLGIGPSTCLEISRNCLERGRHHSHLEFLNLDYYDLPTSLYGVRGQDVANTNKRIKKEVMPFGMMVSKLGIPSWGSDAMKFLSQYDDCVHWMEDVEKFGSWSAYFSGKLGIQDAMKQFYLREYSNDIMVASADVFEKYTLSALHEVPITLSGSLNVNGMRVTKAAYLDLLNQMSPVVSGRKLIQFVNNAAVASNMYVISDEMHTKARVARQREMQTGKKILYGSAEFLEFMRDYFRRMVGGQHE